MPQRATTVIGVLGALLLGALAPSCSAAQPLFRSSFEADELPPGPVPVSDARIFFWGNSAVNHDPGGPADADVGEPLRAMADFAGLTGCADGDYTPALFPSMLAETAYPAPSELNPSMTLGRSCFDESFVEADYTVGVLQDNNFSALLPASGWGDVAGAVFRVNEAKAVAPRLTRWFLYSYQVEAEDEGGGFAAREDFLADQAAFNAANRALQDAINAADPSIGLAYIPLGEVWLDLLGPAGLLADVPLGDLFVDTAPHQNRTAAELMGAVVFAAIHRQRVPGGYTPPAFVDPRVRERWGAISARIWTLLNREPLATRVFAPTAPSPVPAPTGDTFHVAPGGSDGNPGTETAPWGTLAFAVDQLRAGDTLIIDGGTWNTSIELERAGTPEAPIRIVARAGATIGPGAADWAVRIAASHIEVRGLSVSGPRTAFLVGDGLYPLNDVCADPGGFNLGFEPGEQEFFPSCQGRSQTENPVYSDIVIDGATETGGRALIEVTGVEDSATYFIGVELTDEVERVTVRNYEMTGMLHAVFADGIEQIRRLEGLVLENLHVHGTVGYGIRMPARRGVVATPDPAGPFTGPGGRVSLAPVPLRTQRFTDLVMRELVMEANGFTDPPGSGGEAYGNVLIQGWVGGLVERSVFRNGPYWGIDALICDDITYRNNVFSMSAEVRALPRAFPDPDDPWPVVGLEVNGGTGNRVLNNTFYGFEAGLFQSMFQEDFAETAITLETRNNIFWNNTNAIENFPPNDILASSEVETFGTPYNPVGGFVVQRVDDFNLADTGSFPPGVLAEPGNLVDPQAELTFVDAEAGDLRLLAPSGDAVDQGEPLGDVPDDHLGHLRPAGAGHDRGAFEGTAALRR